MRQQRSICPSSAGKDCFGGTPTPARETRALPGVIGDGFGYVEGGIFAAHVVGAHPTFGDDASDGGFKTCGHVRFLEPVEHQLGGQKHRDWVDLVLTGVLRRGAVCRLEHGVGVPEIGAGRESESADEAGAQVADDVAEHVFRDQH